MYTSECIYASMCVSFVMSVNVYLQVNVCVLSCVNLYTWGNYVFMWAYTYLSLSKSVRMLAWVRESMSWFVWVNGHLSIFVCVSVYASVFICVSFLMEEYISVSACVFWRMFICKLMCEHAHVCVCLCGSIMYMWPYECFVYEWNCNHVHVNE